ncbi:MAG TPA: Rv3235 family protein [Streptosporangiaceae bacterium]
MPVPNCLPPYDDELPGPRSPASRVGQSWTTDAGGPVPVLAHGTEQSAARDDPRTTAHDHAVHEGAPGPSAGTPSSGGPGSRAGHPGDEVGQWPSQFAQVLAETLAGARPASQLTPWTTEQARANIRRLGPLLAVDQRPRVQRVRASRPARDVVEVAVIAEFGCRTRALAARLERTGAQPATPGRAGREARWLCTAVESA